MPITARGYQERSLPRKQQNSLTFAFTSPTIPRILERAMTLTKRQKKCSIFCRLPEQAWLLASFEEIARSLKLTSLATVHKHIRR